MTINTGFWVRNYKSFKSTGGGFKIIKAINIIIGKNNIGKSSLIDAVDYMFRGTSKATNLPGKCIEFSETLSEEEILSAFSMNTSGGDIPGNHFAFGQKFIGTLLTWKETETDTIIISSSVAGHAAGSQKASGIDKRFSNIAKNRKNRKQKHVRLDADRDITKEPYSNSITLSRNGSGATNIIQLYINNSTYDRHLIQTRLLTALNEVFGPDTIFSEIIVQHHAETNEWEIYLGEGAHEPVPLSSSGSGLKTVILTLLNLLVRPDFEKTDVQNYVFSFEELENNLHPALQRNLFNFLLKFAQKHQCHIFLTTHSQIAIDLFHGEPDAQIIHVRNQDGEVSGNLLEHFSHGYSVLDDLGAKASDILQANGIIWVEGPSDRIYINKFIELWSNNTFKEGQHYQFIFYGGSVLANINASPPDSEVQEAISAFKINRNFVFICDSDRKHANGKLKSRVTELLNQISGQQGHIWVTRCTEIENYIPKEAFEKTHSSSALSEIGEYEYIQDYLKKHKLSKATEYRDKHQKAVQYSQHFTRKNLNFRPELEREMNIIIDRLHSWNSR